jgi:hypothetical protein
MHTHLSHAWSFGLLLLSCSKPPDISHELKDYADLLNDATSLTCACGVLLGYWDVAECNEALPSVGMEEWRCLTEVLEGHEEAALDYLVCASAAYQPYVDCVGMNYSCSQELYDECTAEHAAALASCSQLPDDVQSAFEACTE